MRRRSWLVAAMCGVVMSCAKSGTEPTNGPVSAVVVSGGGQSGTVSSTLGTAVTIEVRGVDGQPFAGATVSFAASNGGSANPASGTTGTNWRITTTWTLGSAVTSQTLTASTGASVHAVVTANAVASVSVAQITILNGAGQSGAVGATLGTPVTVEVRGSNSLVYPNASVSFSATSGGSLNPSSGTTDAQGRLATTWTLGSAVGTQTMTATTAAHTVNLTATATAMSCTAATAHTLRNTVNGSLAAGDCATLPSGSGGAGYTDRYAITRPAGSVVESYDVTSTAFDTYLRVRDGAARLVAANDDRVSGNTNSRVLLFAATGAVTAEVTSYNNGSTGAYTFTTDYSGGPYQGFSCNVDAWVMPGTNVGGQWLNTADCVTTATAGGQPAGARYYKRYLLYLVPGQSATITIGQEAGGFDTFLVVHDVAAGTLVSDDDSGGGTGGHDSRLTITAPGSGSTPRLYYVDATSYAVNTNGYFFLTVN